MIADVRWRLSTQNKLVIALYEPWGSEGVY